MSLFRQMQKKDFTDTLSNLKRLILYGYPDIDISPSLYTERLNFVNNMVCELLMLYQIKYEVLPDIIKIEQHIINYIVNMI
jgi:hypothetical protein